MFGIFKKTSWTIDKRAKHFFQVLFAQLPAEFQFLQKQLQNGLYVRYRFNKDNNYFISFDPAQSDKSLVKGKNFQIANIQVIADGQQYPLDLTIYEGQLVGFDIQKNIQDLKNYEFDTSNIIKAKSKFAAADEMQQLVKGLHSDKLELDDLAEIEVAGKSYYQIKDLEDGNYIAIDSKGYVFSLAHDPFEVKLLSISVKDFVDGVNSETFRFEELS